MSRRSENARGGGRGGDYRRGETEDMREKSEERKGATEEEEEEEAEKNEGSIG